MFFTEYMSPVGKLVLVCDKEGRNLTELRIEGETEIPIESDLTRNDNAPVLAKAKSWLDRYFSGQAPSVSELAFAPCGTAFQREVWTLLLQIPHGEVTTYGEIAKTVARKLGKERMSAQAVGGAVGSNPIGIIIPCHRVIGENGNLTGYASGIPKKIKLLQIEGIDTSKFFVPKKRR